MIPIRLAIRSSLVSAFISTLLPATLNAAPVTSVIGPTSRATVRISVSVRPRVGINQAPSPYGALPGKGLCLWSSAPLKKFVVTLQATSDQAGSNPKSAGKSEFVPDALRLVPGKRLAVEAMQSSLDCTKVGTQLIAFEGDWVKQQTPLLLLIARE